MKCILGGVFYLENGSGESWSRLDFGDVRRLLMLMLVVLDKDWN